MNREPKPTRLEHDTTAAAARANNANDKKAREAKTARLKALRLAQAPAAEPDKGKR